MQDLPITTILLSILNFHGYYRLSALMFFPQWNGHNINRLQLKGIPTEVTYRIMVWIHAMVL
jgi:hypothetical protein